MYLIAWSAVCEQSRSERHASDTQSEYGLMLHMLLCRQLVSAQARLKWEVHI